MVDKAILLMYYGFPEKVDEMRAYLKDILHGRDPPQKLIDENIRKLNIVGGKTPSTEIIRRIEDKLKDKLERDGFHIYVLTKHYRPSLKDASSIVKEKVVYEIPLFPLYSKQIFDEYFNMVESSLGNREFHRVVNIGFSEPLTDYYKKRIGDKNSLLVFSAHSIPVRGYDPYPIFVNRASSIIAPARKFINIYHSQGPFAKNWLGPYPDYCITYALNNNYKRLLVAPIGFLYEHIEILYDLDWDLRKKVETSGISYSRIPSPNDGESVINGIIGSISGESTVA